MTTDTKTTLLPAARLAEIRETFAAYDNGEAECDAQRLADFTRDLLAHLDALTAPAPADGGEALGRGLFFALHPGGDLVWKHYEDESKAPWIAAALALDAHGYARGRAEGEAERARMTDKFKAIADNLQHMFGVADGQAAENARLTAELAATKEDRR